VQKLCWTERGGERASGLVPATVARAEHIQVSVSGFHSTWRSPRTLLGKLMGLLRPNPFDHLKEPTLNAALALID
jgi:hypothetical protein